MESLPSRCTNCNRQSTGTDVCCSNTKMTSEKNGWRTQEEEYLLGADSSQDEPPSYNSIAPVPSHNLGHIEVQREKELAMMEKFCDWREIWYKTITKCTLSKLLCEPKGMNKLRTHGLAIWVSRRADYGNLDDSKAYLHERAPRNEWTWNEDWWAEATAFKVEYARMVPWEDLVQMLECFPMDQSFLNSFRALYMPNQLRIVAFLAPSFLSYDNMSVWKGHSSRIPPPRWTFPMGSYISSPVQDLIMRTMPYFEPFVTGYEISRTDVEEATEMGHSLSQFDANAYEWITKQVVEQGWYSADGRAWRGFIDKIACNSCKGKQLVPSEVKAGLAFLNKTNKSAGHPHAC